MAQAHGALGAAPIETVIRHALSFVEALDGVSGTVLDLGSGAGVPGLVVAAARPDLRLVLLDRRLARIDALRRAVRRLGWSDRVSCVCDDASRYVEGETGNGRFAGVICRGFGPPIETLRLAACAVVDGGRVVISEPPEESGSRWDATALGEVGGPSRVVAPPVRQGPVAVFHVEHR